ncbi:CusA/CzcA family heavy metal efflux RND transporter [Siphonobacter sp. SORGH_AS_0500]|uniref:CusA/CzcA family heavy metal efflux RND transporter n=1 Tax=Siphonobacter sp. SORGH_AS_0500 TaxID=1864824 RepID=UPI002866F144|nr:CusA/CzcA family heavy metal efflux RND transporter [Siphonobacter sp. SORGH_AS_0500]MDR6194129.1 cobalt-zinc-cadmium resistance protein CzcA [Siphonobacter sp. SORGH_AS_0500]
MLDKIIRFSIDHKLIIGLFTLALIGCGAYSLSRLPIDAVPDITNNQVQVITLTPSLAAPEVERLITFPIEQTMASVPETEEVRSISRFGLSVVTIVFHEDVDIYWARQQVGERLNEAKTLIPANVGNPELAPISTGLGEIYQYTVHAKKGYENKYDAMSLRSIQDWYVRRQLIGTPGVAEVNSWGGFLKQYEVAVEPEKLRSYNLSVSDIFAALEKNNQNTGGAYIDKKPTALFIRSEGLINSLDDIGKIVIKNTSGGTPVLIRDVAEVRFGYANRYGALTRNGEGEAVGGLVMMLKGENSNEVVKRVQERITQIQKTLPEGVVIDPFLVRSELVGRAIGTVTQNLVEGALIVIFVLVVFLGNWRAGLITASVIPLAMLFAFTLMKFFNVSGNLMSLGAIDFGLIVDGAVIIVEATLHHFSLRKSGRLTQSEMDDEVYESASRIRSSAAFGEIIILIVYLPLWTLSGIEGKMFKPMAQVVSFAILGAFILSLTYVPMMTALLLNKNITHKVSLSDRLMGFFHRKYTPLIKAALRFKLAIVLLSVSLLGISVWTFTRLGGEFLPTLEEGDLVAETMLLTGSSLTQTVDKVTQASDLLMKRFPEVSQVIGKIGAAEIPTDPMPMEACDLTIKLKPKEEWTSAHTREELANLMTEALEDIPGVNFGISQPIQFRSNELISGVRQDVGIKIFGEDLDELSRLQQQIVGLVSSVDGAKDIYQEKISGLPQIIVNINRDKLAQFGLDIESVNRAISTAFAGEVAGLVYEGEKRFDLVVRFSPDHRQRIEDVQNLFVTTANGNHIPLQQVADVSLKLGPNQIQREDAKRRIIIGFNVRGRDVQSVVRELQAKIDGRVTFPPGYYVRYGGQFENLQEATGRLSIAVPIALTLILALLYFTFHSIRQSLLIFTAIPMAAIGGVFALVLRDMPFSISAGVGFIALFGVAVLNGIVLIGEFNFLKKSGIQDITEIILKGTETRLRPILMTATVASLGFLPMATSSGAGGEVQKPLATVVIGGLVTSTLLTLFVIPILYMYLEKGVRLKHKTVTMIAFLCILPVLSQAQGPLSPEQAVKLALENNRSLAAARTDVKSRQMLERTAKELPKTELSILAGQYNSYKFDQNVTLNQSIPNPAVFRARSQTLQAQTQSAQLQVHVTENDLAYQVKSTWYELAYLGNLQNYYQSQDSLYANFLRAAQIRLRTGEAGSLESTVAQTRLRQIQTLRTQNEADVAIVQRRLQTLLFAEGPPEITSNANLMIRKLPDTLNHATNPLVAWYAQQIKLAETEKNLQKANRKPDFSVGYFNQSLIGAVKIGAPTTDATSSANRFHGGQVGINFPLFGKPYRARINAAQLNQQAQQQQFDQQQKNTESEIASVVQEVQKLQQNLDYYQNSALPQAQEIRRQSNRGFQAGEIGYVEYLQGISTANELQLGYLQTVQSYNQSIIRLEWLLGIQ